MVEETEKHSWEFCPLTVALETLGGIATPLIPRGTPLPTVRTEVLSTTEDDQEKIAVSVVVGDSTLASRNYRAGTIEFSGIAPAPASRPAIEIRFWLDEIGILQVAASVNDNALTVEGGDSAISLEDAWSPEAVERLIKEAEDHREQDVRTVSVIEAKNRARHVLSRAEGRIQAGTSSSEVPGLVAALGRALQEDNVERIRQATQRLADAVAPPVLDSILGSSLAWDALLGGESKRSTPGRRASTRNPSTGKVDAADIPDIIHGLGRIFGGGDFTLDAQLCFVLMPFEESLQPAYYDHIQKVVRRQKLTCLRADELAGPNLITRQIWEHICRARLLIADLTGRNPNVFYEIGLAHALGKDVVLLTQDLEDVPFDLRAVRCIEYEFTPRGMKDFEGSLMKAIEEILHRGVTDD